VIKEVAPVSGAATDKELGTTEFQTKYFDNHPLYLDSAQSFYSFLGKKSLLMQGLSSWNPFTLYRDASAVGARLKEKGFEGNLKGEGLLKGGLLIIHPTRGVVYRHEEMTGYTMPYDEIGQALKDMVAADAAGGATEVCKEPAEKATEDISST
jgi:hypothetical protein